MSESADNDRSSIGGSLSESHESGKLEPAKVTDNAAAQAKMSDKKELPSPQQQIIITYRKAAPCQSRWEDMSGSEQFRFCKQCQLSVYDFSNLDLRAAQQLIFKMEGKVDHQNFYRRSDGRFLSTNCPVGLAKQSQMLIAAIGMLLLFAGGIIGFLILAKPHETSHFIRKVSPDNETQAERTRNIKVGLPHFSTNALGGPAMPSGPEVIAGPHRGIPMGPPIKKTYTASSRLMQLTSLQHYAVIRAYQATRLHQPNPDLNNATTSSVGSPGLKPINDMSVAKPSLPSSNTAPINATNESAGNPYLKNYR